MAGTKLWQSAGSPIIQGRSRTERPYIAMFMSSLLIAVSLSVLFDAGVSWPREMTAAWGAGLLGGALVSLMIAALPCAGVVWLGREMRWRRPSVVGGIVGGATAILYLSFAPALLF